MILFSEYEINLYSDVLKIPENYFRYVPYGDWGQLVVSKDKINNRNYYFSGGYTNRNYKLLIDTWRAKNIEEELVIIGSHLNRDLIEAQKSKIDNITILLDTSSECFDEYLSNAKACILPFISDTGASGQSVTLRCMKHEKIIISTDTQIMREYVTDKKSGFLIKDFQVELPDLLKEISVNEEIVRLLAEKQRLIFGEKFSYKNITNKLEEVINE